MLNSKLAGQIDFINNSQQQNSSYSLSPTNDLVIANKRSKVVIVVRWLLYIVSFGHISRNPDLDKATKSVIDEFKNVYKHGTGVTKAEQRDLTSAFKYLLDIQIVHRGNIKGKVRKALDKVQKLQVVNELQNQTENPLQSQTPLSSSIPLHPQVAPPSLSSPIPSIPPLPPSTDTRLQEKLQFLIRPPSNPQVNAVPFQEEVTKVIQSILPEVKESVDLSDEEVKILNFGLDAIPDTWWDENAKRLSPRMIRFIVEKCHKQSEKFIPHLLKSLLIEPVQKEHLNAFVLGLPIFHANLRYQGSYLERTRNQIFNFDKYIRNESLKLLLQKFSPESFAQLQKQLTPENLQHFIQSFFGFLSIQDYFPVGGFKSSNLKYVLDHLDDFGPQNRRSILKALSHVSSVEVLVEIVKSSQLEDNIIETISRLNPPEENDLFFRDLILRICLDCPEQQPKLAEYIFKNESDDRKKLFLERISDSVLINSIEHISLPLLKTLPEHKLLALAKIALGDERALQALGKALEGQNITYMVPNKHTIALSVGLVPYLDRTQQINYIAKLLDLINLNELENQDERKQLIDAAEKLADDLWLEASQWVKISPEILKHLSPRQGAILTNGLVPNANGLAIQSNLDTVFDLLKDVFGNGDAEYQKIYLQNLAPQVFATDVSLLNDRERQNIYKTIFEMTDQEKKQSLVNAFALSSFNGQSFHYYKHEAVTDIHPDLMNLLSLDQFKPAIRLIFSVLTNKLDENAARIAANLTDQEQENFNNLFVFIYPQKTEHFINLIQWLYKIDPHPNLLHKCIEDLSAADLPPLEKAALIGKLPQELLETCFDSFMKLSIKLRFEVLKRVHPRRARQYAIANWDRLTRDAYNLRTQPPCDFLIQMTGETDQLINLLDGVLNANNVGQLKDDLSNFWFRSTLHGVFRHFENHPWKLILLSNNYTYNNNILREWIEKNHFTKCSEIFKKYADSLIPDQLNEKLQTFFSHVDERKFKEADEAFNNLDAEIQNAMVLSTQLTLDDFCIELRRMNNGQIFALSLRGQTDEVLKKAIQRGKELNLFSEDDVKFMEEIRTGAESYRKS